MERWNGRVALVTGASAGIGVALCRELSKYGMKVVGCARNVERIKAIASECEGVFSGKIHAIKCDLTKEDDILSMFEEIRGTYGRIDVCINNAGLSFADGSLLGGSTSDWQTMLNVNVIALCICTRESVKLMQENNIDDGQIIQISSMAGHRVPLVSAGFYSGTKFMVRALTEGLRRELRALKSHIRVASISPGLVETEFAYRMNRNDPSVAQQLYSSIISLQAEDIASAMLSILQMPPHVDINDILIRPVEQAQ